MSRPATKMNSMSGPVLGDSNHSVTHNYPQLQHTLPNSVHTYIINRGSKFRTISAHNYTLNPACTQNHTAFRFSPSVRGTGDRISQMSTVRSNTASWFKKCTVYFSSATLFTTPGTQWPSSSTAWTRFPTRNAIFLRFTYGSSLACRSQNKYGDRCTNHAVAAPRKVVRR